jgi:hypothetical protein
MKYIVDSHAKTWPCLWPMDDDDRSHTHYVQTYRTKQTSMLAWLHCIWLTLAQGWFMKEEKEKKKKKRFILYHRSVYNSIQGHRTCWELAICICTCFSNDINNNKQFICFHMMNIFDEVSYKKWERERDICVTQRKRGK